MGEAPRLKPMSSTEILDGAFRLYRNNFATFLGILAVAYVPIIAIIMVVTGVLLSNLEGLAVQAERNEVPPQVILMFAVAVGGGLLYFLLAMPLATGALTRAVGARYLNEPISIGKAYGHILRMFLKYLLTAAMSGLVIGLGALVFVLPGVFVALVNQVAGGLLLLLGIPAGIVAGMSLWTLFFASAPVCVLEGHGYTAAMGRSRELVRGHGWRVFGLLFLSLILQYAVSFPVNFGAEIVSKFLIKSIVAQNLVSSAVQQGFNMLITPFFSVIAILLYYDLRIRKEAFDLEVLAKNLGAAPPPKADPAQA